MHNLWSLYAAMILAGALSLSVACSDDDLDEPETCEGLFGAPTEATGLDEDECDRGCDCPDERWEAPEYDVEFVGELRQWTLVDEFEIPDEDPYGDDGFEPPARDGYCGVIVEDFDERTYRLETFASLDKLEEADARLTHEVACGLCSTLEDLAIYIEERDLTEPVRECGMKGLTEGIDEQNECIEELGFSTSCAAIWSWNATNTREACIDICLHYLDEPYNEPDGSLNDCMACDEEKSGEVFQAVAGRTRRNSGLPSAICRPCDGLYRMSHEEVVQR